MTEHQRNIIPAEEVPELEMPSSSNAEPMPAPAVAGIDPTWDIAKLATRGHVLTERAFVITRDMIWVVFFLGLIAGLLLLQNVIAAVLPVIPSTGDQILVSLFVSSFILTSFCLVMLMVFTGGQGADIGGMPTVIGFIFAMVVFGAIGFLGQDFLPSVRSLTLILAVGGGAAFAAYGIWKGITTREHIHALIGTVALVSLAIFLSWVGAVMSNTQAGLVPLARHLLTYDPSNYFDIGGGLRGGPQMAWMASNGPKPESLTSAQYAALTKAVTADIRAHAADVQAWTATAEVTPPATITRAGKVLSQYADKLKTGVVIIPEGYGPMSIVAHVEGQWSVTLFGGGGACATVLGPVIEASGCQDQTTKARPLNEYSMSVLNSIKPTTAKE